MERRRDFRHLLRCPIQVECERTARVLEGLVTRDVSASGLSFLHAEAARVLAPGDRVTVELLAPTKLPRPHDALVLGAPARVVRVADAVALAFDRPLAVGE
jgi:hypothetical protein